MTAPTRRSYRLENWLLVIICAILIVGSFYMAFSVSPADNKEVLLSNEQILKSNTAILQTNEQILKANGLQIMELRDYLLGREKPEPPDTP